jgi:hypothetical protein
MNSVAILVNKGGGNSAFVLGYVLLNDFMYYKSDDT